MHLRSYSSYGIVLAKRNFGEADRILTVLTEKYGKTTFMAKGIRRPSSRKRGHLEVFNLVKISVSHGQGIEIITEAEVVNNFDNIRLDLNKVALAFYFVEIINKILAEKEPHPEVFKLLNSYLSQLEGSNKLRTMRQQFIYDTLTILGFWPTGKLLANTNSKLAEILERQLTSERVGKKITAR